MTLWREATEAELDINYGHGDPRVKLIQAMPVEPEHQHQWLPWLTLPNGSSWTQCTVCEEQFQYDHA